MPRSGGDVETVVALLRQGADVNAAQGDGMTALHWAAMSGNADMVDVLLYAGAATEATTRLGGYTALHLASRAGHAAAITALVSQGADPAVTTSTGAQALHLAAGSGSVEAVSALLAGGAEVDAREGVYEQTPLMWATAKNRVPAMTTLLDAGADVNARTRVVDYGQMAQLDGPDRQARQRILQTRIEAQREARAQQEATLAEANGETQAEEEPAEAPEAVTEEPPVEEVPAEEAPAEEPAEEEEPAEDEAAAEDEDDETSEDAEEDEQTAAQRALAEARQQRAAGGGGQAAPAQQDEDEDEDANEPQPLGYSDLVGKEGGLSALHFAARDGYRDAARLLLDRGADLNVRSGDGTSPLLMATINGNYDLAMSFLEDGADPTLESEDGATPLFATLNNRWAPKALFPQPTAFKQQETDYLQMMQALIDHGADVNHRTKRHIWYTSFNFDLLGVDFMGATPFWRAAYALDVSAMRLLMENGADPNIPTQKPASRRFRRGGDDEDESGLPPVPAGGPAVYPIHAASGVGYGEGFAANAHRHVPDAWLSAVRYLVEELGADVNARDHNGYSPVHHAAARGDNQLIEYLVSQGADVTLVSRRGQTTVDMANSPVQRISPFPATIELLEGLGAKNNNNCAIC